MSNHDDHSTDEVAAAPVDRDRLAKSTSPGSAFADGVEATGGADAVPLTPADDGLAGREDQGEPVEPPAES